jgi:hypothetical protein
MDKINGEYKLQVHVEDARSSNRYTKDLGMLTV